MSPVQSAVDYVLHLIIALDVTAHLSAVAIALRGAHFGGGTGSIWLEGIDCRGSESQLQDCLTPTQRTSPWSSVDCGNHQRDAGVLCLGMSLIYSVLVYSTCCTYSSKHIGLYLIVACMKV